MELKPRTFRKTVTTAGTRERLTSSGKAVPSVVLQAESSNTGVVYVGDNQVSSTNGIELNANDSMTLTNDDLGSSDAKISLKDIWLDVSVGTDGVNVMYEERG